MHHTLPALQPSERGNKIRRATLPSERRIFLRISAGGDGTQLLAVTQYQGSQARTANRMSLLQYHIEHRREVARRGVDDPQYLGSRGLLLQCLARLGDQPCVLDGDDRLICE